MNNVAEYILESPHKQQYKPIDVVDFMKLDLPPRSCLMSPWLPEKSLAMIYGPRGAGKTYFAQGIAHALVTGTDFLSGRWVTGHPASVLIIDGEMPQEELQKRFKERFGEDFQPDADFQLLSIDMMQTTPNFFNRTDQERVIQLVQDIDVLILDSKATLFRGRDENDAGGWGDGQEFLMRLRRMGKTVILIHHAGKSGSQRGTSALEDVMDTVIKLSKPTGADSKDGTRLEVSFEKHRGFHGEDTIPFIATLPKAGNWQQCTVEEHKSTSAKRLHNEGLTQQEIAEKLQVNQGTVSRWLK